MGRRNINERNIRKLTKVGGGASISITLPIEIVRKLKWRDGQKVVVEEKNGKIIITDWES